MLAVVLALGLLIVGGVALWGALTNRGSTKSTAASPLPSAALDTKTSSQSAAPGDPVDNKITLRCLASQCQIFVASPGPTDVVFRGALNRDDQRVYTGTRVIVQVDDASTVAVAINGRVQRRGRPGQSRTYETPTQQ